MNDGKKKSSFWETLPKIIMAIGILFVGSAALITALHFSGIIELLKSKSTVSETPAIEVLTRQKTPPVPAPAEPKQGDNMTAPITGMKFVYVPEGCFIMGSDKTRNKEKPVHKVCVNDFWMGKYEVTQGQWRKIMGGNPAFFQEGDSYPVENISWNDSQNFIKKLNGKVGKKYRLPTEAEWEYACRANMLGKYCGGDTLNSLAWHNENSGESTHPVGKKQVNDFGLHDMNGNVREWCADWFDANYYSVSPQNNPTGPISGSSHVIRGGSWGNSRIFIRSTIRFGRMPDYHNACLGFRLVFPIQ